MESDYLALHLRYFHQYDNMNNHEYHNNPIYNPSIIHSLLGYQGFVSFERRSVHDDLVPLIVSIAYLTIPSSHSSHMINLSSIIP